MAGVRYAYLIKIKQRYNDGIGDDFEFISRSYSSLRKAIDYLEFWRDIYLDEFSRSGYDVNTDASHWVDLRLSGAYSFLNRRDGNELLTMQIERVLLF
jgi:hypothetical protein